MQILSDSKRNERRFVFETQDGSNVINSLLHTELLTHHYLTVVSKYLLHFMFWQ